MAGWGAGYGVELGGYFRGTRLQPARRKIKGNNDLNFAKLIFSQLSLWLRLFLPGHDLGISEKMRGIDLRADAFR